MNSLNRIRWFEAALPALLAVALILAGLAPAGSSEAYSQRRSRSRTTTPKPPPSEYDQGYLKGYADGYKQGGLDWKQGVPRNFERSEAYQQRESRYNTNLAASVIYRQGYDLGLELGYADGYYGRADNKSVPVNGESLARAVALAQARRESRREERDTRGDTRSDTRGDTRSDSRDDSRRADSRREASQPRGPVSLNIPRDTEMQIRLTTSIDTKNNRVGDKFNAVVISPSPYDGATIEGHIATLNKSGKVTGRTELGLAFDKITLEDGRSAPIEAELRQIVESETVKKVDEEGRVESGSRSKDSQVRGGVGAAAGAILGGILGGGKGALLGAVIGGAAGVGTVYIEGSKDLILDPGTDMVIRILRSSPR